MVWQPEINEVNHRKQLAQQMGGPEGNFVSQTRC